MCASGGEHPKRSIIDIGIGPEMVSLDQLRSIHASLTPIESSVTYVLGFRDQRQPSLGQRVSAVHPMTDHRVDFRVSLQIFAAFLSTPVEE